MKNFKVYEAGNERFFVDTDSFIFAKDIASEHAKNGHEVAIKDTQRNTIESYYIGKYEIYRNARGYSVSKKGRYNRDEYLKSIYAGEAVFVSDYTHQKHYKSLASAKKAVKSI